MADTKSSNEIGKGDLRELGGAGEGTGDVERMEKGLVRPAS